DPPFAPERAAPRRGRARAARLLRLTRVGAPHGREPAVRRRRGPHGARGRRVARAGRGRLARCVPRAPPHRREEGGGGADGPRKSLVQRRAGRDGRGSGADAAGAGGRQPRVRGALRLHLHRVRHGQVGGRDAGPAHGAAVQRSRGGNPRRRRGAAEDHPHPPGKAPLRL
ncbi:MAG: 2-oxo-4-hydroxy-4-carboxy-5-ureidoimidazoline (OHCU) decarboxylase, partial [uncultured Gemmatimonadetes bacterium]